MIGETRSVNYDRHPFGADVPATARSDGQPGATGMQRPQLLEQQLPAPPVERDAGAGRVGDPAA